MYKNKKPFVFLLDDDEDVVKSLHQLLSFETNYKINIYTSPHEALKAVEKYKEQVDVVVSESFMPAMDGITFLSKVKENAPRITQIILTGYADQENAQKAINELEVFQYLQKPWQNAHFLYIIAEAIRRKNQSDTIALKLESPLLMHQRKMYQAFGGIGEFSIAETRTVVVVDDEEMVLTSLRSFLELETDYEVATFTGGSQALEYIKENAVDLIISDYLMPEMDGITLLSNARDINPQIQLILLTGYADKENAIKSIKIGLDNYIEKPWSNEKMLFTLGGGLLRKSKLDMVAQLLGSYNVAQYGSGILKSLKRVFISYSHHDVEIALRLKDALEEKGIDVLIDVKSTQAGSDIGISIKQAIAETDVTLSLVSNKSLLSGWVAHETIQTFLGYSDDTYSTHRDDSPATNRKFIACYIEDDFLARDFTAKAIQRIDNEISEIEALIVRASKQKRDTVDLNSEKSRHYDLRHNLDKIIEKLRGSNCIDIREDKFSKNLPKIIEAIKS